MVLVDKTGSPAEVPRAIELAVPRLYAWLMPASASA